MKNYASGEWVKREGYKSFEPSRIYRPWSIEDLRLVEAMSRADRHLGRLDSFSDIVPNLDLFVEMHVTKEANQSSRIEGTRTEIEEAILPEEEVAFERRDDWREVQNYIAALKTGRQRLDDLPFSTRLLRETHAVLMRGVRGEHKTPGDFRRSQNWIGGSNPGNARFVPPHPDGVPELMSDLEKFAHDDESRLPPLFRAGVLHYQFETIHPFLDGNGRIGRLMIALYLMANGILKQPVLYLSDYFERNREEYYERLTQVRTENDLAGWMLFFLDGVAETAKGGWETFNQILKLQRSGEETIRGWKTQSQPGLTLFHRLFTELTVNAVEAEEICGVSLPTAYKVIERFENEGYLTEVTGAKRGKRYLFTPYLRLFR